MSKYFVGASYEVAEVPSETAQYGAELSQVSVRDRKCAEYIAVERCDCGEHPAAVKWVGLANDQRARLQPVERIRDAGCMDLESFTDLPGRELATAAEGQQHQYLVAGERQAERPQCIVDAAQQELMGPHHRRDGGHPEGGVFPPGGPPVLRGQIDGVNIQWHASPRTRVCVAAESAPRTISVAL